MMGKRDHKKVLSAFWHSIRNLQSPQSAKLATFSERLRKIDKKSIFRNQVRKLIIMGIVVEAETKDGIPDHFHDSILSTFPQSCHVT